MATKAKRSATAPRHPEKKWGPFHEGVGVAVWLNEVQTDAGPRFFLAQPAVGTASRRSEQARRLLHLFESIN